jgi:hypothetical protein
MEYELVLCHHGTKGMKWGVRRYQNKDGSLTPAGKKRYENSDGSLNAAGKEFYKLRDAERRASRTPIQSAKGTTLATQEMAKANVASKARSEYNKNNPNKLKSTKNAVESMAEATNKLSNLEKQTRPKPTKVKMDLSHMTDQEMRSEINRALLEKQYNEMFAPQKVNKGRERLGAILSTTGTVLAVGSSALGIALAIKELSGK